MKKVESRVAVITKREDGILSLRFKENAIIEAEDQDHHRDFFIELAEGKKRPILFSSEPNVTLTKEARERAAANEALTPILALAIVADSLAYKLIANFYIKFHKPLTPFKVFTSEGKAVEWLKTFL